MYPSWRGRSEPKVGRGGDFSWGRGRGRARTRFLSRPRLRPNPGVGRGGVSCCARSWTWMLSASPWWVAQQSERGERRCFPVKSVSERAKWLRSLRPCRLRHACQDKVSGDPHIEWACDTVGWWGDLAKVASQRSLPELGFGRVEGAPVAWGGPRARREFVRDYCSCPRPGSGEARSRPLVDEALTWTAPISLCGLCWWWLPVVFRSVGGTPNYGTRQ
jgi:hypothetical protein